MIYFYCWFLCKCCWWIYRENAKKKILCIKALEEIKIIEVLLETPRTFLRKPLDSCWRHSVFCRRPHIFIGYPQILIGYPPYFHRRPNIFFGNYHIFVGDHQILVFIGDLIFSLETPILGIPSKN